MRTKVTLVLIFLNVALFFFIFKFERNWRTETASLEARRKVLGAEAADIRLLEVTNTVANTKYRLVRNRDTWSLTEPLEWPANPHAASGIVNELILLEHEASFRVDELARTKQSLADFGLDKPKITVGFSSGDPGATDVAGKGSPAPKTLLRIGDATPDGKRLYVLSPDGERVHVVKRNFADALALPQHQLRAETLLSIRVFEAKSLLVQTASPEPSRTGTAGVRVRIRKDGTRWRFDTPITAYASKVNMELVINELNALSAKSFIATSSGPLPSAASALRITVEGTNRHETLYLGEKVPDTSAPTPKPITEAAPVEYFAQLEGRNALFTVAIPPTLLEKLRNAQDALREKRILVDFDPSAVTAISIDAPGLSNQPPVTLQRLEPPAGQTVTVAPPWQIVRRAEGQAGPQTRPADRAAVQRVLERLSLLSADKFKSDAPTSADLEDWGFNQPVRIITLTLTANAIPVIVRLGTDPARNVYARVGTPNDAGTSIYQVSSDILTDLSVAPLSWWDRAVMEPLPTAARIAALKLTDIEAKSTLYESEINPAGAPTETNRDPKIVQSLVQALQALRAREFVPGGFTETTMVAGEERPWRFQLDASIVLPSVGGLEQKTTLTVYLTERLGGNLQHAGIKDLDVVFSLEQPLIDALWTLAYGARDPGPPAETKK